MAHGALSDPTVVREMTAYAFENGLTLVGVAGDENSYHAMYPAVHDNIVFTHSIRYDTGGSRDAVYSYTNTWNCNNFGMRMTVVAPSSACATGASANITGMVGLMHSAARDAGFELHAGEVYQILTATADDVWLTEQEREISGAYPVTRVGILFWIRQSQCRVGCSSDCGWLVRPGSVLTARGGFHRLLRIRSLWTAPFLRCVQMVLITSSKWG